MNASRITLVANSREEILAQIERMAPEARREVSPEWLAAVHAAAPDDPWLFGYAIRETESGRSIGTCGFKAPPNDDGMVEIAYGVNPEVEGRGFATEAAGLLVALAFETGQVRLVRAHTFNATNASTRVLQKNGFHLVGPVIDPEDGEVWRWEKGRS